MKKNYMNISYNKQLIYQMFKADIKSFKLLLEKEIIQLWLKKANEKINLELCVKNQ